MGKRRRHRSQPGGFWRQQYGGAPMWLIAGAIVLLLAGGAYALLAKPTTTTADPNRTMRPVPTFSFAPSGPSTVVVSVLGDSYTAGSAENTGGHVWPSLVKPAEGYRYVLDIHAVGGVGYTRGGDNSIPSQAARVRADADVVILFGSRNDYTADPSEIATSADDTLAAVQSRAPDAAVVMVGFPWTDAQPPQGALAAQDALADAAERAGVTFVSALEEEWLLDEGLIGGDRVHPTDAGHDIIASRMSDIIASAIS